MVMIQLIAQTNFINGVKAKNVRLLSAWQLGLVDTT